MSKADLGKMLTPSMFFIPEGLQGVPKISHLDLCIGNARTTHEYKQTQWVLQVKWS